MANDQQANVKPRVVEIKVYVPECPCGFEGLPHDDERDAIETLRSHVALAHNKELGDD